ENGGELQIPARLISLVGQSEAESLMKDQATLRLDRQKLLEGQLNSLARGRSLANEELAGLKMQENRIVAQLRARRDQSEKIAGLRTKGLVSLERSLEQEIRILDLEEKS